MRAPFGSVVRANTDALTASPLVVSMMLDTPDGEPGLASGGAGNRSGRVYGSDSDSVHVTASTSSRGITRPYTRVYVASNAARSATGSRGSSGNGTATSWPWPR